MFIHYFGFSISPQQQMYNNSNNYTKCQSSIKFRVHNLLYPIRSLFNSSNRIRPKARSKVAHHQSHHQPEAIVMERRCQQLRPPYERSTTFGREVTESKWIGHLNHHHRSHSMSQPQRLKSLTCLGLMLNSIKTLAILATFWLAFNHCLVFVGYLLWDTSKDLFDLLIEFRLVITKLSSFIFVLDWHFNRNKIAKLIKLTQTTSNYIFQYYKQRPTDTRNQNPINKPSSLKPTTKESLVWFSNRAPTDNSISTDASTGSATNVRENEKIVLLFWIMSLCITCFHFSLSEAEVSSSTAQHLWSWLEDYSFNTMNNRTTTWSTLITLASIDNYVYTVHVYGTRLIGASVICISCSLQVSCLKKLQQQVLLISEQYNRQNIGKTSGTSQSSGDDIDQLNNKNSLLDGMLDNDDYFLLQTECKEHVTATRVNDNFNELPNNCTNRVKKQTTMTNRVIKSENGNYLNSVSSGQLSKSHANGERIEMTSGDNYHLRRARFDDSTKTNNDFDLFNWPKSVMRISGSLQRHHHQLLFTELNTIELENGFERQVNSLANNYALISHVNYQMDKCFGPMMLIQFSALFLMSCIDVVYFSLSYGKKTKTQSYIIISGMILLWWPHLLLYRYSSCVATQSGKMLKSVKRMFRQVAQFSTNHFLTLKSNNLFRKISLSIGGVMQIDKFFLINFARIIITFSVMIIQLMPD